MHAVYIGIIEMKIAQILQIDVQKVLKYLFPSHMICFQNKYFNILGANIQGRGHSLLISSKNIVRQRTSENLNYILFYTDLPYAGMS